MADITRLEMQTEAQIAANERFAAACNHSAIAEADYRAYPTPERHAVVVAARLALAFAWGDRGLTLMD